MKRLSLALAVALAVLLFLWKVGRVVPNAPSPASVTQSKTENLHPPEAGKNSKIPVARSALADTLNSPSTDIAADLHLLDDLLATFRTNLRENPVGTNAEITAALTGANPLHLALIPRDHPAINSAGELCDRWGTPFFFHQLSASQMEIRSAGPDRQLWTPDDSLFTP